MFESMTAVNKLGGCGRSGMVTLTAVVVTRDICGKGNRSNLDTVLLSVAAVVDLLRDVAAEHPDSTESNVYLKVKGFSAV